MNRLKRKHSYWRFQKIGNVLIVQVPVKNNSPHRIHEYLGNVSEKLETEKEKLQAESIIVVPAIY